MNFLALLNPSSCQSRLTITYPRQYKQITPGSCLPWPPSQSLFLLGWQESPQHPCLRLDVSKGLGWGSIAPLFSIFCPSRGQCMFPSWGLTRFSVLELGVRSAFLKERSMRKSWDRFSSEKWESYFQTWKDAARQKQQISIPGANKKSKSWKWTKHSSAPVPGMCQEWVTSTQGDFA